jgi:hypothetical protein
MKDETTEDSGGSARQSFCFHPSSLLFHPSSFILSEGEVTMPGPRRVACGLVGVLAFVAGCQRLNYDKIVTLDPEAPFTVNWDPPRYDQKLTVTVTSSGKPVSAYLVKESDQEAATRALQDGKMPAGVLASQENAEEIHLSATIPAKTGFTLVLVSKRKAEARVQAVGR